MKANKKSLHAKLYQLTYPTKLPENLCPYFWKLVIALIILIPNYIMQLPKIIAGIVKPTWRETNPVERVKEGMTIWLVIMIIGTYFFSTWHLIKWAFQTYNYNSNAAFMGGMFNSFIGIIATVIVGIILHEEGKFPFNWQRQYKEKTPNIVIEFIKAKYNNYCPKIEWK